jgi:hypothetical protein
MRRLRCSDARPFLLIAAISLAGAASAETIALVADRVVDG